jgi:nucleoside transporter
VREVARQLRRVADDARIPRTVVGLWLMCFFLGMGPGFWTPALTNLLEAKGLGLWVTAAFLTMPCAGLISPLIGGALADQKMRAERLLGWIALLAALTNFAAFWVLDAGWNPWWFIGLLALNSLIAGPMWGLGATIALSHLRDGERQFPLVRMGGTVGWMAAGFITSYVLHADHSTMSGYAAVVARLALGVVAFTLPATLPRAKPRSWASLLGLDAFGLMKQRELLIFFLVTGLLSIPLAAFYIYTPRHLAVLGDPHPTGTIAWAQWTEIATLLVLGTVMKRWRVKTVLLFALCVTALRFILFTVAGVTAVKSWLVPGVVLHGVGYTFYFITAQIYLDRRVPPSMRGQAQGLMVLISGGLGTMLGTMLVGALYRGAVVGGHGGWAVFWGVLASITLLCVVLFAAFYRSSKPMSQRDARG